MNRFFHLSAREFLFLVVLFVVSLPAVTSRIYASDEVEYFAYLRSLYFDRDVSFENEYRYFHERGIGSAGFHETFLQRETAVGRRVNYATIGSAILWAPFYAVADAWTRIAGTAEANGLSQPYIGAVAYGTAFYGLLAVLLSVRAARLVIGGRGAVAATLAVWLGTPLLFYMYVAPAFAHATSAFAVALFVNVWLHVRRDWSPRGAFALGLCVGLMAMVREQDAFLALGPAVDFLWATLSASITTRGAPPPRALARGLRSAALPSGPSLGPQAPMNTRGAAAKASAPPPPTSALAVVAGTAGVVLGFLPQLLAYNALNGYPGPAEHVSRKMYWASPFALGVLASPAHGFLVWTPLAALALVGIVLMVAGAGSADRRMIGLALLIMVVSQVYVAGSVASWTVAGAFGQRRFVCLTVVLVIGLAELFARVARAFEFAQARALDSAQARKRPFRTARRTRVALGVVVVLTVWWNIALMMQFATRLMDRQRLEPARNAYHAFVTLPAALPDLVYRYFTDRESFYERTAGPR